MKQFLIFSLIFVFAISNYAVAQTTTITCIGQEFHNGAPNIFAYDGNNVFHDLPYYNGIPLNKVNDKWVIKLQANRVEFLQLENAQLLIAPNQSITVSLHLNNEFIEIADSNNINFLLQNTTNHLLALTAQYNKDSSFKKFMFLYSSIKIYIDSVLKQVIQLRLKYSISNEVLSALRQYYLTKIADFAVLPILYKNNYSQELIDVIGKDIKIGEARFWLETQWGRIFLKTFFTQYLLPKYKYDLSECLLYNNLFNNRDIKKLLTFYYFDEALNKQNDFVNLTTIRQTYEMYLKDYSFTKEELRELIILKGRLDVKNNDVSDLFGSQTLLDMDGKELTKNEKQDLLKNASRVIIDYWASWCGPCKEKINQLKSDKIEINGKIYSIIFVSIDKNQQEWIRGKYPFFNNTNSFRITDLKSTSFYTSFKVTSIPRCFLIENGHLISQDFSY